MIVAALSTRNEIAITVVGGLFILFALASSFVFPRRDPNWPGKAMPWFVTGAALFFVAMLAAVLIFGVEKKRTEGEQAVGTTSEGTPTLTTKTTASGGGGGGNDGGAPAPYANGDATAGKAIFTGSAGCGGCHTLKDAGSNGNVGPNLDEAKPDASLIVTRVTKGKAPMPAFKGQLSDKQIADVVAYVYGATH